MEVDALMIDESCTTIIQRRKWRQIIFFLNSFALHQPVVSIQENSSSYQLIAFLVDRYASSSKEEN